MCFFRFPLFFYTSIDAKPPNFQNEINQETDRWYRCAVCFEQLFKAERVVGTMGKKTTDTIEEQDERRFLIVDWTYGTKMHYTRRVCSEGIRQFSVICSLCGMFLSAPVQVCLGRTVIEPENSHDFRHYKKTIKKFSFKYQVIRSILIEKPRQF